MSSALTFVLVFGLMMGAVYLLIALGFSLVCGVLRIFHLGYAYFFPLTIYGTWLFISEFGLPLAQSIVAMVVVQLVLSVVLYKFMIRRTMETDELTLLTGLLLTALIIEQLVAWRYPIQTGVYLNTTIMDGIWKFGRAVVPKQLVIASIVAVVMTSLFALFFIKTKMGLAVRALSQDILNSQIVGLNVEKLYSRTMMLILLPVVVAMLLIAPVWTVEPAMGWQYMTTAILISVLGGLGNIKGTIIASFLIGFTHSTMCFLVQEPRFMNLSALVLVMVILIVRPQGIARSESLW
ncbi:MAG: branched-chain amino acid ABC transporter permease [Syntrophales bacterium]|jgi:branched-chain amino acid transport system permease protein|nr:branched-chain amino acid ABC transporter permease [Syntrophales bacterium]MDY0044302.1 branched-chain amino acid ABC transporter permease [Syntrophales bacterium]